MKVYTLLQVYRSTHDLCTGKEYVYGIHAKKACILYSIVNLPGELQQ